MKIAAGMAVLAGVVLSVAVPVRAQAPSGCTDEKSHQFDFWIGEWTVTAGDKVAGTNTIRPILDGCVLQENWTGARGEAGSSLNHYDPSTGQWRQYWVWRSGTTLEFAGEYSDGRMVLSGESKMKDGKVARNRITWYANQDGTVRQHWEMSTDDGKSWNSVFDGLYRRK